MFQLMIALYPSSIFQLENFIMHKGFSEAKLEITPEGVGKFSGNLSLELPANTEIQQSGYAAIRSKVRPSSMFGTPCFDTTLFRYLALRVRGDHRKYFVNIQTDGVIQTDLYQHRLFLRNPGEWQTVMVSETNTNQRIFINFSSSISHATLDTI